MRRAIIDWWTNTSDALNSEAAEQAYELSGIDFDDYRIGTVPVKL